MCFFFHPTLHYTWACRQIRIPAFSALWCQNNAVAHIWMFAHTGRTEISFLKITFTAALAHFSSVYRVGKHVSILNTPEDDRHLWAPRDFACSYLRSYTSKSFRLHQRLQPMEQMIQRDYILATQTYRIFALTKWSTLIFQVLNSPDKPKTWHSQVVIYRQIFSVEYPRNVLSHYHVLC